MTAGFLWGAPWRQREVTQVLRAIQRTALLIGIGIIVLLTIFPNELGSRLAIYSETLMPNSPTSELVHRTQAHPLMQLGYAFDNPRWPYGFGIGTCTPRRSICDPHHACPLCMGSKVATGTCYWNWGLLDSFSGLYWAFLSPLLPGRWWWNSEARPGFPWHFPFACMPYFSFSR